VVVGGGVGGLCASIVLGAQGRDVHLFESSQVLGGKAGTTSIDGVEVDTGPSVLTLPEVFDDVFSAAGMKRDEVLQLRECNPGFRYIYHDGVELDVYHSPLDTVDSIRRELGGGAAKELEDYLGYAAKIWEAASPHFVMAQAPDVKSLLLGGMSAWGAVSKIDPFKTMLGAIRKRVKEPHLRRLLMRYATYNGSDVRRAPATLGCISHVELSLGGYGVEGGMVQLVHALRAAAERVGVSIRANTEVARVNVSHGQVTGVEIAGEGGFHAGQVVMNGEVSHLFGELLEKRAPPSKEQVSMSAFNGVFRAKRADSKPRVAHTVLFPDNYEDEFAAIFDAHQVPAEPTVYLCAQERCHGRGGWPEEEPLFAMINAPSAGTVGGNRDGEEIWSRVKERLLDRSLLETTDQLVWKRSPRDLADRFPGSLGALYGAASNSAAAAFQRPANRVRSIRGLFLASGTAHPGGGLPMVAQSGKLAAAAAQQDFSGGAL